MLMLTTSSLCPKGVSSFDPAVFEASISSQVSGNLLSSRVRDEGVSGVGNTESSVLDLQPPPASYNFCNVLTSKSSLNLPKERLCSLQGVVLLLQCSQGAISQYVKLVIGIWTVMMVLLVSNLREPIVKLLLWMSLPHVTTHNSASVAKVWDIGKGSVLEWPLVSPGNFSRAEDLVESLAVDFSCLQSPSGSFSIEDVWDS